MLLKFLLQSSQLKTKLIGIWDTDNAKASLGKFIIFQEELSLLHKLSNSDVLDLVILKHHTSLSLGFLATLSQLNPVVNNVLFLNEKKDLSPIMNNNECEDIIFWPHDNQKHGNSYTESTLAVQELLSKVVFE